jgi:redox-sensing transcriptional repressor
MRPQARRAEVAPFDRVGVRQRRARACRVACIQPELRIKPLWRVTEQLVDQGPRIALGSGHPMTTDPGGIDSDQHAGMLTSRNMPSQSVPDIVVGRLPLYLRALSELFARGKRYTSSQEIGDWLGMSSAQIRKDLSHFGEFGKQGMGYSVEELRTRLSKILRIDTEWPIVIIGAGHIGRAVANYPGFADRGFRVKALFDTNDALVGENIGVATVMHMRVLEVFVRDNAIRVAMISVPAAAAQGVADVLVNAGVRALLNYAPVSLNVPAHVRVENIDPVLHLQHMTYYLQ